MGLFLECMGCGVVGAILIGFSHIFFHTDCTISHKSIE